MPSFPTFVAQRRALGDPRPGPRFTPDTFGGAAGRGLQRMAAAGFEAADEIRIDRERADVKRRNADLMAVRREMAEVRLDWHKHFDERATAAEPGAPGFTDTFLGDYRDRMKEMRDKRTDLHPDARMELETSQLEFGSQLFGKASRFQSIARGTKARNDVAAIISNTSRSAFLDPYSAEIELAEADRAFDGFDNLPAGARETAKRQAAAEIAENAISGMIEAGDLDGATAAIAEGPFSERIDGKQAEMLTKAIEAERRSMGVAARAAATEARHALQGAADRIAAGYDLPADERANLEARIDAAGDADLRQQWAELQRIGIEARGWRKLTPSDLADYINVTLAAEMEADGASEAEFNRRSLAERTLATMERALASDALTWASGSRVIELDPIDMDDAASVSRRNRASVATHDVYGVSHFFTVPERAEQRRRFAGLTPEARADYVTTLRQNAPDTYMVALGELSDTAMVDAYIGGMAAGGGRFREAAVQAWQGREILRDNPARRPRADRTMMHFRKLVGDADRFLPPALMQAMRETADALYVKMGGGGSLNDKEAARLYLKALTAATGGDGAESGIVDINGGRTWLPAGLDRDTFVTAIERMSYPEFVSSSETGGVPVYANGDRATMEHVREDGQFYAIGNDRYMLLMDGDPNPVLDAFGKPFIFVARPEHLTRIAGAAK